MAVYWSVFKTYDKVINKLKIKNIKINKGVLFMIIKTDKFNNLKEFEIQFNKIKNNFFYLENN